MTHSPAPGPGRLRPGVPAPAHAPTAVPAPPLPAPSGSAPAPVRASGRDLYLDLLRALALVRVVAYHTFGWGWLTLVFPSMGVMFALAGSLMARSLDGRLAGSVLRDRTRRLLPPLWIYGLVVLPALLWAGFAPGEGDRAGWWWLRLACWVVPLGTPPFPAEAGGPGGLLDPGWGGQAAGILWYLRAYFWFVLLSPLLLRAYRRATWAALFAPLALAAVLATGAVRIPGAAGEAVTDFAVYGSCWMLGFAHHDGLVKRLPRYIPPSLAPAFMGAGVWWASGRLGPDGWDLNDVPLANALYSFGFCVLLLRLSPRWERLPGPLRRLEKPVALANNRAITLYLWHEIALLASVPLIDLLWRVPGVWPDYAGLLEGSYPLLMFLLVWPLTGLCFLAFGWAEDLAARRRPRLWPTGRATARTHRAGRGRRRSHGA